jgi:hypothetical protein
MREGEVPDCVIIASCDTNTLVSSLSFGRHLGGVLCYVFNVFGFVGLMDVELVQWGVGDAEECSGSWDAAMSACLRACRLGWPQTTCATAMQSYKQIDNTDRGNLLAYQYRG